MAFRVSYKWQLQSSLATGWSENFWNNVNDYSVVQPQAVSLKQKLNKLHGIQAFSNYIALSYVPKQRKVRGISYPTAGPGVVTADSQNADFPTTCLLITVTGTLPAATRQWIKGIPDVQVANAGRYVPSGTYQADFNDFRDELTDGGTGWSIYIQDPTILPKLIRSIDALLGIMTVPAHGYVVGTDVSVRVSGVTNLAAANGLKSVFVVDANTLQLNEWTPVANITVQGNKKTVTLQNRVFQRITNATIERISKKNVGRPTKALSGRRRRVKKA